MTRNDLYDLELVVNKNIDRIKREQDEYRKGVEYGIELMFEAVRKKLALEEENAAKKQTEIKDCSNCNRKNKGDPDCKICISAYDARTKTTSTPSHWQPISNTPKGE